MADPDRADPDRESETGRVTRIPRLASTVFLVCTGYYVGGIIGIALRFPPSGIATIWPPTAILLATLLLTPMRTWWVYLLAAVPTHMLLVANFQPDVTPVVMFTEVGSNDVHAVLGALAVRGALGAPPRFDSLRSMALYILYAAIAATVVVCALAACLFVLTGWATDFWLAFRQRVLANVFAIMTIPPLIVVTAAGELAISTPLMILAAIVQERQRAEDEARREREELAHVLRIATLGELTASLAHEINQPLTAIVANAQAARRLLSSATLETAPVQEALTDIAADANRASQVIRRLRALFRKEHEKRVAVDANALIDDTVALLRADIEQRCMAVRFARGEGLPRVLGDPVQLQQVMLNLVVNACEAIDAASVGPGAILIETTRAEGHLGIAIRDTGIGVEESELERIFEHFVSSKPHGLGMGLAISRSIIQAHGGQIWATANTDMGLTVHVDLPVHGGQPEL